MNLRTRLDRGLGGGVKGNASALLFGYPKLYPVFSKQPWFKLAMSKYKLLQMLAQQAKEGSHNSSVVLGLV